MQCPALNRPANGRVTVSSRSVGGVASYSCLSGYSRIGTSTRTCQSDGSWSGQQPRCKLGIVQNDANVKHIHFIHCIGSYACAQCSGGQLSVVPN